LNTSGKVVIDDSSVPELFFLTYFIGPLIEKSEQVILADSK
jgi:hypothetical protein